MNPIQLPAIIQGGMGVAISDWKLARAVSMAGQLGVVSATAIDTVLVRRLQDGDAGGHVRGAMAHFPFRDTVAHVLERYFRPEGRPPGVPYLSLPMHQQVVTRLREQITMLGAFVEVHLAKHGHDGHVGVNLLTKIQIPNLASLYGAMLAGVDFVLMGAGIPKDIPAALAAFARHEPARIKLDMEPGTPGDEHLSLDPAVHWGDEKPELRRPRFLPIVASTSLATMFARKIAGVDGLVIEGPTAGGHNAPPRGEPTFNDRGEPQYGERDEVDLARLRELGLPFWLAGGTGCPQGYRRARAEGAAGVQVGTLFAYCDESGLAEPYKRSVLEHAARGEVDVFTDPLASPTGYPFKVVRWPGDPSAGQVRKRVCDLGYLRTAYRRPDGLMGYRCASEPEDHYVKKGGELAETQGRRCLCNALLANIGMAQSRADGSVEPPLLTSGDELQSIGRFLAGRTRYSATDVIRWLLGADDPVPATT